MDHEIPSREILFFLGNALYYVNVLNIQRLNKMATYAITYSTKETLGNSNGLSRNYAKMIAEKFDDICCEFDDGISFIQSDLDAETILTELTKAMSADLLETVYVMKLAGDFASNGTTKVIRELENKIQPI